MLWTAGWIPSPHADPLAGKIIYEFAATDLLLPNAEIRLQAHLGNRFIDVDWRPALRAVMDAEPRGFSCRYNRHQTT